MPNSNGCLCPENPQNLAKTHFLSNYLNSNHTLNFCCSHCFSLAQMCHKKNRHHITSPDKRCLRKNGPSFQLASSVMFVSSIHLKSCKIFCCFWHIMAVTKWPLFLQTFSKSCSAMNFSVFWFKFCWNLFSMVQIRQHWLRWWLGTEQATGHYPNQWWARLLTHINWLVQERCKSSALSMELHLSCTNPSIYASLNLMSLNLEA